MPESQLTLLFLTLAALLTLAGGGVLWQARQRHLNRWLASYVRGLPRWRSPRRGEPVHVLLCVADHYEPKHRAAFPQQAQARVDHWVKHYPRLFGAFRDSDGRPPRHTFFYPMEQYEPAHLEALAFLCRQGFGEVE